MLYESSGTYQLIIADAETHEPIDILPNRRKETIYNHLRQYGAQVDSGNGYEFSI